MKIPSKKSEIDTRSITAQGEVNGRWVIEHRASGGGPFDHPAGTMVCESAVGEGDDVTFTAPNGKRYSDLSVACFWTQRGE